MKSLYVRKSIIPYDLLTTAYMYESVELFSFFFWCDLWNIAPILYEIQLAVCVYESFIINSKAIEKA